MRGYIWVTAFIFLMFSACKSGIDSETYKKYRERGTEITNLAQTTLLANVGGAIQKGGPEYAVEFCNLEATGIIDSLNSISNCIITRVSEKNRNPENVLKSKADLAVWEAFRNSGQTDTVVVVQDTPVYYKRINTAMPACLKCHGDIEADINRKTLEILKVLYPEDLATGYELNEFRGLWKVEFSQE